MCCMEINLLMNIVSGLALASQLKDLNVLSHTLLPRIVVAVANPKCAALAVSIAASPAAPGVNPRHHAATPPPAPPATAYNYRSII